MRNAEIGRVYRHFKGDYYLVENLAHDSETGKRWSFTASCTAMAGFGCDRWRCSWKRWIPRNIRMPTRLTALNCSKLIATPGIKRQIKKPRCIGCRASRFFVELRRFFGLAADTLQSQKKSSHKRQNRGKDAELRKDSANIV